MTVNWNNTIFTSTATMSDMNYTLNTANWASSNYYYYGLDPTKKTAPKECSECKAASPHLNAFSLAINNKNEFVCDVCLSIKLMEDLAK